MADIAVIDLETTGLGKSDRIVEIGVVRLEESTLNPVDEFESLVYPARDVGPTRIHGITATMVSAAPRFDALVPRLGAMLDGAVLAAHNLPFDRRFLASELERAGITANLGEGICTLSLTRASLENACREFDVERRDAHRALTDARACAALLRAFGGSGWQTVGSPASFPALVMQGVPHTLHRDQVGGSQLESRRSSRPFRLPADEEAPLVYLHLLDLYLADGVLSMDELADLKAFAASMSLSDVEALHARYLEAARRAVEQDGRVSPAEIDYLSRLHGALGVAFSADVFEAAADSQEVRLSPGVRVCFTGEAMAAGRYWSREELIDLAATHGLIAVEAVTKKGCDALVAADVSTASGKADKARHFGIPILGVEDFVHRLIG